MSVFLTEIYPEIRKSLEERQTHAASRDKLAWYTNRTPWVRLTSMASVNGDSELRKKWILFAGLEQANNSYASGYSGLYNLSTSTYGEKFKTPNLDISQNTPIPGITSASITTKDTAGSLREASISFTCWNLDQLNVLENLYMVPGISCLLEWGWNIELDGTDINADLSKLDPMPDFCISTKIKNQKLNTGGHYDALQGPISGFNTSLREDGGFDCTITLTSMGSSFINAKINSKTKNLRKRNVGGNDAPIVEDNILGTLWTIYEKIAYIPNMLFKIYGRYGRIPNMVSEVYRKYGKGYQVPYPIDDTRKQKPAIAGTYIPQIKAEKDDSTWWSDENLSKSKATSGVYVTWDYFEHYFINSNFSLTNDTYTDKEIQAALNTATVRQAQRSWRDPDTFVIPRSCKEAEQFGNKLLQPFLNSTDQYINYTMGLFSSDPLVCILPDVYAQTANFNNSKVSDVYKKYITQVDSLQQDFFNSDHTQIKLSNILINLKFIYECIKTSETLSELVYKVANGISDACGGIWKFQLVEDPGHAGRLMLVDIGTTENISNEPFVFRIHDVNSITRQITFQSETDPDLRTIAMYSTTRRKSNIQKNATVDSDAVIYNMFGYNVTDLTKGYLRPLRANELGETDVPNDEDPPEKLEVIDYLTILIDTAKDVYENRTPETASACNSALKKYLTEVNSIKDPQQHLTYPITPISMSITIDGIGGLEFGNMINIDYKPERYDLCKFAITQIKHEITPDNWVTIIDTQMRLNHKALLAKADITPDLASSYVPPTSNTIILYDDVIQPISQPLTKSTWDEQSNIKLGRLHPLIRDKAVDFINAAAAYGCYLRVNETFRTFATQNQYYMRGRDANGIVVDKNKIITTVKGGHSYHNYGLAMDLNDVNKDTKKTLPYNEDRWKKIGALGKSYGFRWGGSDFGSFIDTPHFDMPLGYSTSQLLTKHNNGEYDSNGFLIL